MLDTIFDHAEHKVMEEEMLEWQTKHLEHEVFFL